jgi:septal ring-binding cell division protein DamX
MSKKTIAALGLSLALLLGGCAQGAAPEAAEEPVAIETQDSGYGEMATEPEMEAPAETTETESVESDAAEESDQESNSTTASPTASPSPTATTSPTASATASPSPAASPTASPTATAAPTPEPDPGFTLAEVATRNTASSCWVAISGNVYDLTDWITRHPGGAGAITQLCGRDATSQFLGQHGGQSRPVSTLAGYFIGPLR